MKKLLTVLAASVGIAAFADTAPLSATSFEGYNGDFSIEKNDAGSVVSEGRTWAGTTDADGDTNVITAYGEAATPANRPDYYKDATPQEAFLKVDSTDGLARYVNADGVAQDLTSNVYFDMDVQFTVSDSVQEAAEGDKLLVWLYAPDTEDAQTNLVVTAATIDPDNLTPTVVNYVAAAPVVAADTWYRLTVVSTTKDFDGDKVPHFQVYIDGTQVIPTGTMASDGAITALSEHDGLFGSLVKYSASDTTTTTLTSVTFKGTGAVDDLVVTTEKPSFIEEEVETFIFDVAGVGYNTFAAALSNVEAGGTITMNDDYDLTTETAGSGVTISKNVTLALGEHKLSMTSAGEVVATISATVTLTGTGTIENSYKEDDEYTGIAVVVSGGTLVIGTSSDDAITFNGFVACDSSKSYTIKYFSSTEPELTVTDGDNELQWSVGTGDDEGYYVISDGGEEPPASDTHEVAANENLSADGTLTLTAGQTKIKIGEYTVTDAFEIDGTTATIKPTVVQVQDTVADAGDALVIDDENDTVTINVNPVAGLYYGVQRGITVIGLTRPTTLTQYTGENKAAIFTVKKPNAAGTGDASATDVSDKAFFKVFVDVNATVAE